MSAAFTVEASKVRRSRVVVVASLLQVVLIPLLAFLLVRAAEADTGTGVLAGKSQLLVVGHGWDAYVGALGQVAAAALFVGAGVVVGWVFGREHAEGTFGALFALPTSRGEVARAKLAVSVVWIVVVSTALVAVAVALGVVGGVEAAAGLPSMAGLARLWVVAASTMLLAIPVALVASVGRGYLPAVGAVVVVLAVAQISVFLGAGAWFPFSVPGLLAVADGVTIPVPGAGPIAGAVLVVVAGAWATVAWWERAEVV